MCNLYNFIFRKLIWKVIPTPIPRILTLIPRIPIIPTLIPRIPIIPLIPFSDSPFRLLQIALEKVRNSQQLFVDSQQIMF